jgi:hypothetical protein
VAEIPRRVFLPDVRGNDQYLRATWHPDTAVVVVSHWVGEVCVASTPLSVADASKLIGLLVTALQDTATKPFEAPVSAVSATTWTALTWERIRRHFQPKLAQIIAIHRPPGGEELTAEQDR